MEQELLILPEHMSSPPVIGGVHVTRSLILCVCFVDRRSSFLAIALADLVRYTDSDYPYGIFKLFLYCLYFLKLTKISALVSPVWI